MGTTPYYQDDLVTLYHGDCREVREWLSADVLVTDPPYGMNYQSGHRKVAHEKIAGDKDTAVRDAILAAWGATRPAAVFGTWRVEPPPEERQRLIWWKRNGGPGMGDLKFPWGTAHEDVYLLGNGWALADGVKRVGSVIATDAVQGGTSGVVARAGHPTAKPVGLLEQIIVRCPPGIIADPCAGGGSTLLAARNLGRRAIGIETHEPYCEIIADRLSQGAFDFGALV